MKINDLLQKPKWRRRLPSDRVGEIKWKEYTQDDFLDELYPTSHKINSEKYKSLRPKFKINKETGKQEIVGYDDVERVAWALEEVCLRTCTTHCFGSEAWFGNEGSEADGKTITKHKAHWNMAGMKHGLQVWGYSAFATGDSAIYLYREGNKVKYKVFSYLNGDKIYMPYKDTFVRQFEVNGTVMIEVYDTQTVSTYVQTDDSSTLEKLKKVLGKTFNVDTGLTEDGWKRIERVPHGSIGLPVFYMRLDDVVWGAGVAIRERIERNVSAWGDSNNYFAFPIFWFNGKAIKLPDMGVAGKAIGFSNTDGKAGILSPPDASTSFLLDLEKNMKAWCDACGVTMIDPKDLKGGSEASGAYLRNLYFTSVIWAQLMISKIRPDIDKVIDGFLRVVGQIEGQIEVYKNVKMSWVLEPFVPTNKQEDISIINNCVAAGTTSVETGAEEIAHNNPFELERIKRQKNEELERESAKRQEIRTGGEEPIKAKNDDPPIDNRLKKD